MQGVFVKYHTLSTGTWCHFGALQAQLVALETRHCCIIKPPRKKLGRKKVQTCVIYVIVQLREANMENELCMCADSAVLLKAGYASAKVLLQTHADHAVTMSNGLEKGTRWTSHHQAEELLIQGTNRGIVMSISASFCRRQLLGRG